MTQNSKTQLFATGLQQDNMLSKVPEVTIYFWLIKVLCTTVGETASDFLNVNLGFGLTWTSVVMGIVLFAALIVQFKARKYVPVIYWSVVVLISIFGTLITDIMTDNLGVPLEASTLAFSVALALTFALWFTREKTLSIHSITSRSRESFYWLAILFTFALGTAAGDLMAEQLGLGYLWTGLIVCAAIAAVTLAWGFRMNAVLTFWIAYILTRPLGASLGDYLSQAQVNGGLGLGATVTSAIFLLAILAVVVFLSVSHKDAMTVAPRVIAPQAATRSSKLAVAWQVVTITTLLVTVAGSGYAWRTEQLHDQAAASSSISSPLGDLSEFRQIATDTLGLVRAGDLSQAKTRVGELELAWDDSEAQLRAMNSDTWTQVDDAIDAVLRNLRSVRQDAAKCSTSLESLVTLIDRYNGHGRG